MRTSTFFVALFALSCLGSSQADALFINKPVTYHVRTGDFENIRVRMPTLVMDDKAVQARINASLTFRLLDTPPLTAEQAKATKILLDGLVAMNVSAPQVASAGRALSFSIHQEAIAASYSSWEESLNFDAHTGRVLSLEELFTQKGLRVIAQKNRALNIKRLDKLIAEERKSNEKEHFEEIDRLIDHYENCAEDRKKERDFSVIDAISAIRSMTLGKNTVSFEQHECSLQVIQYFPSEVFTSRYANQTLRRYMTPYGKYILLGEGDELEARATLPLLSKDAQLFHGKINQHTPITLFLSSHYGTDYSWAIYSYDKVRSPLFSPVEIKNGQITLTYIYALKENRSREEIRHSEQPLKDESLTFKIKGKRLIGQWTGKVNGKIVTYPFEATAF